MATELFTLKSYDGSTLDVQITEPIHNDAGAVILQNYGPTIKLKLDARMKAAGITIIKSVGGVEDKDGKPSLAVQTNKGSANLLLETRPELAALVANCQEITGQIAAVRQAKSEAESAVRLAADNALRETMRAEAEEIAGKIPSDHVRVTVTKTGNADGYDILEYEAEGVKLNWSQVTHQGTASAIRPGAQGAFDAIRVVSIRRADLERIRGEQAGALAAQQAKAAEKASERARCFAQAKATGEPVAIHTYMDECDAFPAIDCSLDAVTVWALPDGTEKETRIHTH